MSGSPGSSPPRAAPARSAAARAFAPATQLFHATRALSAQLTAWGTEEHTILLVLGAVIGAAAGLAVIVFYRAIDVIQLAVLRGAVRAPVSDLVFIPLLVALGLVVARSLTRWGTGGSTGENIPDVMYRVTVKGGVMPSRPVLVKSLAAAVVIGTGGSVGAEGPVVVLGAAAGSRVGRWLRASPNRLRTLVGCGAAAGISAAFNAPIAGVIFGIEKILGSAGGMALGPFVVASILAATVGRTVFGEQPVMALPAEYGVGSPWELVLYVGLGVATGVVAVLYARGVWRAQDAFGRLPRPWMRVVVGALVVGALNLVFRADLWGQGHQSFDLAVIAERTTWFLLALAFAKLAVTALTFAAGGVGGVFTPALFIGATLGGAFGVAAQSAFPDAQIAPGALGLVGMAGLVAGSTHAPLTAIMMVFEMTGDYGLILPLMLTSVLAYGVARRLYPESIYTEWLMRRGVVLSHGADAAVLARYTVGECVNRHPVVVPEETSLDDLVARTRASRQTEFPVVDHEGRLVGMLSRESVREAREDAAGAGAIVLAADLATPARDRVTVEDSLLTALRRLGRHDVDYLPVVRLDDRERLDGVVSRQDLLAAYERVLMAEHH